MTESEAALKSKKLRAEYLAEKRQREYAAEDMRIAKATTLEQLMRVPPYYANLSIAELEKSITLSKKHIARCQKKSENEVVNGYRYTSRAVASNAVANISLQVRELAAYIKVRLRIDSGLTFDEYKRELIETEVKFRNLMDDVISKKESTMIIVNPNAVQSNDNEAKQGEIPVTVEQTKPKATRKPRKAKATKAIVPVCTDIAVIPKQEITVVPVAEIAAQDSEEDIQPKAVSYASVDVSRRLLLETVKLAAKASGKADLVLHVTTDGYLRVVGGVHTDAMLVTRIPAAGRLDDISIGTNAAKLLKVLNRLSGEQVNLELTLGEQGLIVRGNAGEFTLATREMAYPEIVLDELLASFVLTKGALASQIKSVMYAVAHNDVRYYLNGMYLHIEFGQVFVVGTDGNRLALSKSLTRVDTEDKDVKGIIPASALKTLLPLLESDVLGSVRVMVNEEYARIAINNNVTLFVRLVDGRYPCYQSVIPDESRAQTIVSVDRAALLKAVDSAEVLANEKYKGVRISNDGSLLKITSRNPDKEVALKLLPASITGDDQELEVGVNACYLSDALKHIDDDVVNLRLYGANNAILIEPHHGLASVQAVIMPMRL